VRDFRVELHAEEREGHVPNRCVRTGGRRGEREEGAVDVVDLVAVRHPHRTFLRDSLEEIVVSGNVEVRPPEFAVVSGLDRAAQVFAGELHAVADAKDGDAHAEDLRVHIRGAVAVNGRGAAGEDDALGLVGAEFVSGDCRGDEHGERAGLADASRDELSGLGAEVQDRDDLRVGEVDRLDVGAWGSGRGGHSVVYPAGVGCASAT